MTKLTTTLLSTDNITGDNVKNMAGEDIGSIKEMMIDIHTGKIEYAVLSFGGFLGMGDKLFAIPWDAFDINAADRMLRLDVDKDRLDSMPGFDKEKWPSFADTTFLNSVNRFYDGYGRHRHMDQ